MSTRTVDLTEILEPQQLWEVVKILKHTDDDMKRIAKLKKYYKSIEDHLLVQGVLPEYLAYATEYMRDKILNP